MTAGLQKSLVKVQRRLAHRYVLIGGTASNLAMEDAGLAFRATKDLDVVWHIEAFDALYGE